MSDQSEEMKKPDPWNDGPWNEIASLVLFGIGIVTLLALGSYRSADVSWNNLPAAKVTYNLVGPFGANLADLLYQIFGLTAFAIPLVLFLFGWWQWNENRSPLSRSKVVGTLMMMVALTGIFTILSNNQPPKAFYLGGTIGRWLVYGEMAGLSVFLGSVGAVFALVLLFMIGLVITTQISIVGTFIQFNPLEQRTEKLNGEGRGFWSRRNQGRIATSEPGIQGLAPGIRGLENAASSPAIELPRVSRRRGREAAESSTGSSTGRLLPASSSAFSTPDAPATPGEEIKITPQAIESPYTSLTIDRTSDISQTALAPKSAAGAVPTQAQASGSPSGSASARKPRAASSTKRTPRKTTAEVDDLPWHEEGDSGSDDFDAAIANPTRTIADMMASASVVRPEPREELETSRPIKVPKSVPRPLSDYKLPSTEMLTPPAPRSEMAETELLERARQLAEKCNEFNVSGQVMQISPGPVVTTFEFKPDPGVKYSRVTSLVDDLCLGLKAESIRIDRIPGKSTVGIEVPNSNREMIRLREVIESKKFRETGSSLTFAIGKTIDGSNYAADLAKMPHLLIAGATGAGKSVMLNAILVSLLYKSTPDEVKMILVDPKRLELGLYADIPHLLTPIVTDPKRASYALKWAVSEMENRYKNLAVFGVRNIDQYNKEVCGGADRPRSTRARNDPEAPQPLPFIVVVIDELADLMMVSARDVEESITRLAQMARAVGIHLVLATQRPSVDVITGLIKANFPSRISFRVSSKVDSRTIIDANGAEQLLGQGDMLFLPPGTSRLVRVHGAYVDEKEVKRICDFVRSQANPNYDDKVVMSEKEVEGGDGGDFARDEKYDDALRIILQNGKASTSLLQRTLRIGYGRAASIIDMMHREGIVGPEDGSKPRQVLVKTDFLERLDQLHDEKGL